jgi:two-component system sensor histidine kinase RegB
MPLNQSLTRWVLDDPDDASPTPGLHTRRDALRNLAVLRFITPVVQAGAIGGVQAWAGLPLLTPAVVGLLFGQVLVALLTVWQLARRQPVLAGHVVGHALLDIAMFFAILYHTGGASNPFSVLIVLPYLIASSALAPRWVTLVAASAVASYLLLRAVADDLVHPDGIEALYRLHVNGIMVTFVTGAVLLALFVNRMNLAVRRNERALSRALAQQARNDSVTAVGALAAGYAHELGSPLGTMALIVEDLRRRNGRHVAPAELQRLEEQIAACKRIISQLAEAGGRQRAEAAGAVRADRFFERIVTGVRNLHPGASLAVTPDPAPAPVIVGEESLRQAVMNVVENAVQASPHDVQVALHWSGALLRVVVRDRGPGLPAEVLRAQGTEALSTRPGGHGLGLMLSATTLDHLGGRLLLANRAEGGAEVTLELPMSVIVVPDRATAPARADRPPPAFRPPLTP